MSRYIESLDQALSRVGQDIVLRRVVGTSNQVFIDCVCRAFVRKYEPQQLVGTIVQGDSMVIISPTDIEAAQWPGGQPVGSPPPAIDRSVPRKNDKVIIEGVTRNVEAAAPIYAGGELVRIELQVRG